jgi:hypothetical protein
MSFGCGTVQGWEGEKTLGESRLRYSVELVLVERIVSNQFQLSLVIVLIPSTKIWHAFCMLSKKKLSAAFEALPL